MHGPKEPLSWDGPQYGGAVTIGVDFEGEHWDLAPESGFTFGAAVLIIAGTNHLDRSDSQLEVARLGPVDVTEPATAEVIDEQSAPIDHLPYERSGFDHRQSSCPDADTSPVIVERRVAFELVTGGDRIDRERVAAHHHRSGPGLSGTAAFTNCRSVVVFGGPGHIDRHGDVAAVNIKGLPRTHDRRHPVTAGAGPVDLHRV